MTPEELQKHIVTTYTHLRIGIGVIAFLFPFFLVLVGFCLRINWQHSMSAYYYATATAGAAPPPLRPWFVGLLLTLGGFLVLYNGFSKLEDWCLNLAGLFAVGVAIFPMPWPEGSGGVINMHYVCAVLLFICVGIVTLFCTKQTLELVKNQDLREWFKTLYSIAGSFMLFLPPLIWLCNICLYKWLFPQLAERSHLVFWEEAVCIGVFAFYWLIKSYELRDATAELNALQLKLTMEPFPEPEPLKVPAFLKPIFAPIQKFRELFRGQLHILKVKNMAGERMAAFNENAANEQEVALGPIE